MGRSSPPFGSVSSIDAEQPVDEGRLGSATHRLDPEPELAFPEHSHHLETLIDRRIGLIDWKPSVGLIKRFSFPWSPSSRLLRYFTCRCWVATFEQG
jgi:hypothetical protein